MNILIATYSYYPYNFGGTEVYVSGLTRFLNSQGHNITIIAGMPEQAFKDHSFFYQDDQLKTVKYKFDEISVVGVIMKNTTTDDIYGKYRCKAVISWGNILNLLPENRWDILHYHAHTFAIGKNILDAVKKYAPAVKIVFSYHLPVSCVKSTLVYGNQLRDCNVKPTSNICSACYLAEKKNITLTIGKSLLYFLPKLKIKKFPFFFRMKYLIQQAINAFEQLGTQVDCWQIFSEQILNTLLLNGVKSEKIFQLHHGVDKVFLNSDILQNQLKTRDNKVIFLYVGRFEKIKGFHTLLKSWILLEENEERRLEIIGEMQSDDLEISTLIKKTKARNDIHWHGKKTQPEIAVIMKKVHCTIIPSEWVEIGPLVFHESISRGCDVIASDIGGCKSLSELYKPKSNTFRTGSVKNLQEAITNFKYSGVQLSVADQFENYRIVESQYKVLLPIFFPLFLLVVKG